MFSGFGLYMTIMFPVGLSILYLTVSYFYCQDLRKGRKSSEGIVPFLAFGSFFSLVSGILLPIALVVLLFFGIFKLLVKFWDKIFEFNSKLQKINQLTEQK